MDALAHVLFALADRHDPLPFRQILTQAAAWQDDPLSAPWVW